MQFELFPPAPLDTSTDEALARSRPQHLYLGTSSWTFRGWAGLVYRGRPTQDELVDHGLAEYARHPLFNTVAIDRSYYAPLTEPELAHYAKQLPAGFQCVMKVWKGICAPFDPKTRNPNPMFFDALAFRTQVLSAVESSFKAHCALLLFQIPPMAPSQLPSPGKFAMQLEKFFAQVPREFRYAVEVRNIELMSREYLEVLKRHRVSHTFNHWERMPSIKQQLSVPDSLTSDLVLARLMLPQGVGYEAAREAFAPFDRLQAIDPEMRRDVRELWSLCLSLKRNLFIIVNNKAEGSSPLTVRELLKDLS